MKTLTRLLSTLLICAIITAIFLYRSSQADTSLVVDDFNYATGQLTTVSGGAWVNFSGTGNFIQVSGGSLTYAGYPSSGVANKIDIISTATSADDVYRQFATQASGTTYAAFLVNVTNTTGLALNSNATGDVFAGFLASSSTTNFASRVSIRLGTAAGTYQLGLRASGVAGNVTVFSPVNLTPGTTNLIVVSYQIIAGATNDATNMWINPTLGGAQPAADLSQVSAADIPDVARFFVRQGTTTTPNASIDGVRVSDSWQAATSLQFRSAATGDWNNPATWESSADGTTWVAATTTPTSIAAEAITIRSPHTVTVTAGVNADQLTVDAGATLAVTSTLTNDGTTTINGSFQLNTGGVAAGNEFVYGPAGSLIYNHIGPDYVVGFVDTAWPFSGGPFNVTLQNGGGVNLNDFRDVFGTISLLNGTINSAFNLNIGNGATIVRRAGGGFAGGSPGFDTNVNVIYDGTTALTTGTEIPSTSSILQNLTITNTGGVTLGANATANASTVIGAGARLATGAFTFTNSGTTTVNGSFQINQGGFANGNNFSYDPVTATLIFNNSSGSFGVSGTPAYWPALNGPQNVTVQNGGGITVNVPRTVGLLFQYSAGVSNMGNLTLNGVSQVNTGGFTSGSPTYGVLSLLKYNTGGTYGRNGEWLPGAISGAGYPHHVQLSNNTTLDLPNGSSSFTFQMAGDLTIDGGSTMQLAGSTPLSQTFTIFGNLTNNGTLNLSTAAGGNVNVGGSWANNAAFNANGRTVNFNGSIGQTISGNSTFFNLTKSTAVAQTLTFAALSTQTVTNALTLNGASGNLLNLRSSAAGVQWKINAPATQSVSFVDVKDSDASGGATINATGSVDSGNNINWGFGVADYTVTTSATAIVVTDVSNNGDTLTVSEPAGGQVKFAAPGRFFSVNGGPLINDDSGNLVIPTNSITINAAGGADTINVGAFVTSLPALGISGGAGDDTVNFNGNLTFDPGRDLSVDLQSDPTPGTDTVNFNAGANVVLSGSGPATVKVSKTINFFVGSKLQVANGNLTLEANQQAVPTAGNFRGIFMNSGGTITTTGTGNISLKGKGGADAATPGHYGISINLGALVSSTSAAAGAGTITLEGIGATGLQNNRGIEVVATGTVTSVTGDIQFTGTGGTGGPNNYGISILNGGVVTSTGAAKITFNGTGGNGTSSSTGSRISGEDTKVTSAGGDISITGLGGSGTGSSHHGVSIALGALVSATNGAKITANGTGGTGSGSSGGVIVSGFGPVNLVAAKVSSDSGDISFTGTGGNGGLGNIGWNIDSRATVVATGPASISINGTGGTGTSDNYGVGFEAGNEAGTGVSSVNGNITIIGAAVETSSTDEDGVRFEDSAGAQAVSVNITGTGQLNITGTAGNAFPSSHGINIVDDTTMSLNGANNAFNADSMDLGSSNTSVNAGANALTVRQKTFGRDISLGSPDSTTELGLLDAELDIITAATLNIGDTGSGVVRFFNPITRTAATNVNIASLLNVILTSSLDSAGGNVFIRTGPLPSNVLNVSGSGVDVSMSTTGTLSFFNSTDLFIGINGTTVDTQYHQLNVVGKVDLTGVDLVLSGSHTPVAGQQFTIVNNDGADAIISVFNGAPEGGVFGNFLGSNLGAKISYVGGDGNDVVLTVVAPEIVVEQPAGNGLIDNVSTVPFGSQQVGVPGPAKLFTVRNIGQSDLNITVGSMDIDTGDFTDFTLNTAGMATTLAPNGSTTFTVTFTAGAAGPRSAVLHIPNTDTSETSFDIGLSGNGTCPGPFVVNSNGDAGDATPGDGICATAGSVCTLRAAVEEGNATAGSCTIGINFNIGSNTITVGSVLSITHSMNINGPTANSVLVGGTPAVPTRIFQTSTNTTVNISNLTVSGGRGVVGAGLLAAGPNSTTTLDGMLFTGNVAIDPAGFAGGGGAAAVNGGTLNIRNSTFSGNTGTHGGAISLQGGSPINLVNVTITNNLADGNTGTGPCPAGGSVDGNGGGIQGSSMPPVFLNLRNSIVAFNQDCNSNNPNLTDLILDQGNNITFNDPQLNLGPLQNNGGPTFTYGLQAFSSAIDAGNDCVFNASCSPFPGLALTNDQRGPAFPRMVNGDTVPASHVDIGAFEKQAPSASFSSITGRLVDSGGTPVEGAAISLSGSQDRLTVTDKEGNYRFAEVATNGFYTVTPSRANFRFTPSDRSFTQLGSHTDALFTAVAVSGSVNPLDTTEYFVRQQYVDFLGREPDEAGLSFWVNNINGCGADAVCRSGKRADTSAAFFLSIEFHETGYLVYRAYQSAYGEIPGAPVPLNLAEFRPDTAQISEDLIVNAPGWQVKLEANKQAYFAAFVARARFTARYANTLTPAEFVDRLFANAGVTPGADDRAAVIAEFANAGNSSNPVARAHALRRVAENSALARQKENQAFVLMQYFGYLGRDPNALPDGNFAGYDFWLNKLEEFNGDFRRAEMVKAFLVAGEYRGRFPR